MNKKITIEATVNADMATVWEYWNSPEHIVQWAHASEDWECTSAINDLRVGGRFVNALGAKDKSAGFDFAGTYTAIEFGKVIESTLDDGRTVSVKFEDTESGVQITQTFEMENQNPEEMQRAGWQAFLDNFKKHTETLAE